MPIYNYVCLFCENKFEFLEKINGPYHTVCPSCGKEPLLKKVTAASFTLKGDGWYVTDFKNKT